MAKKIDPFMICRAREACVVVCAFVKRGRMAPPAPTALTLGEGMGDHSADWLLNTPPSETLFMGYTVMFKFV
jgi:hypothetical protein